MKLCQFYSYPNKFKMSIERYFTRNSSQEALSRATRDIQSSSNFSENYNARLFSIESGYLNEPLVSSNAEREREESISMEDYQSRNVNEEETIGTDGATQSFESISLEPASKIRKKSPNKTVFTKRQTEFKWLIGDIN